MRNCQEIYFIVNEGARTGRAAEVWKLVRGLLKEKEIAYKAYETKYKGHATSLAAHIAALPQEVVYLVVLGGILRLLPAQLLSGVHLPYQGQC